MKLAILSALLAMFGGLFAAPKVLPETRLGQFVSTAEEEIVSTPTPTATETELAPTGTPTPNDEACLHSEAFEHANSHAFAHANHHSAIFCKGPDQSQKEFEEPDNDVRP